MAKPIYYSLNTNGTAGPDVALIQKWLNGIHTGRSAVPSVNVDGKYGPSTAKAVTAFQKMVGLKQDGKVGIQTWNALYDLYSSLFNGNEQYPGILMRNGSRGSTVRSMQDRLSNKGFGVTSDGIFGNKTEAAAKKFQTANGLSSDGIVGPKTWSKLYA